MKYIIGSVQNEEDGITKRIFNLYDGADLNFSDECVILPSGVFAMKINTYILEYTECKGLLRYIGSTTNIFSKEVKTLLVDMYPEEFL